MAVNPSASVRPSASIVRIAPPTNNPTNNPTNSLTNNPTKTLISTSIVTSPSKTLYSGSNGINTNELLGKNSIINPVSNKLASVSGSVATVVSIARPSIFKYILIVLILIVMIGSLILFINKPAGSKINDMYAPVVNFFKPSETTGESKLNTDNEIEKNPESSANKDKAMGVDKIKTVIDEKRIKNNIDSTNNNIATNLPSKSSDKSLNIQSGSVQKRAVEVPVPYVDTTLSQKKDKSAKGFCFIGEDRGARSCIQAGIGDICMSGDIFPSMEICINPRLRE